MQYRFGRNCFSRSGKLPGLSGSRELRVDIGHGENHSRWSLLTFAEVFTTFYRDRVCPTIRCPRTTHDHQRSNFFPDDAIYGAASDQFSF